MATHMRDEVMKVLAKRHFGITIDETTDRDTQAQLGMISQYWDFFSGEMKTNLLGMILCKDATADGLSDAVFKLLQQHEIPFNRYTKYNRL